MSIGNVIVIIMAIIGVVLCAELIITTIKNDEFVKYGFPMIMIVAALLIVAYGIVKPETNTESQPEQSVGSYEVMEENKNSESHTFCPNCGTEVQETWVFCSKCGKEIESEF